jgi:pilus assembly protein Flp/PilA
MKNLFTRLLSEQQGQDLIEYALLAGLISIAGIMAITSLGTTIQGHYTTVGNAVTAPTLNATDPTRRGFAEGVSPGICNSGIYSDRSCPVFGRQSGR